MPVSGNMQTRVIISAEDRGLSRLMRRLSGEADATIAKFGALGNTLAGLTATFTAGFGVKKAIEWIDEMETSVFSIATTLTDTMHGLSSDQLSEVFDKNARHAKDMYRELQKQAKRSIADVQELMNAYQMFATVGIPAPGKTMPEAARQIDQLVTRIKLATKSQNQEQQIFQELRGLLQGKKTSHEALGSRFGMVDPNYSQTIKQLVARGNWDEIFNYVMSLVSNIRLEEKIKNLLSTKLKIVQGDIKEWAMEAFMPLKDEFAATLDKISGEFQKGDKSPFVKGITEVVERMTRMFAKARDSLTKFLKTDAGKWFMELTPKILAMAGAMTSLTMAVAGLKAAMGVFYTLPGMAMGAWMGYEALKTYNAQRGTQFSGNWIENKPTGEFDWDNFAKGVEDVIAEKISTISGTVMSFLKTTLDVINLLFSGILELITGALAGYSMLLTDIKNTFVNLGKDIIKAKDLVVEFIKMIPTEFKLGWNQLQETLLLKFNSFFISVQSMIEGIRGFFGLMPRTGIDSRFGASRKADFDRLNELKAEKVILEANIAAAKERMKAIGERETANWQYGSITTFLTLLANEMGTRREAALEQYKTDSQVVLDNWQMSKVNKAVERRTPKEQSAGTDAQTRQRTEVPESLQVKDFVKQGHDLEKLLGRNNDIGKAIADMEKLMARGGNEYAAEMANVNATLARFNKAAQAAGTEQVTYSQKLAEYIDFMNGEGKDNADLKAQKERELAELYNNEIDAAKIRYEEIIALFKEVYAKLAPELTRQGTIKAADSTEEKILSLLGIQTGSAYWNSRASVGASVLSGGRQIASLRRELSGEPESLADAEERRVKATKEYKAALAGILPELERQQRFQETINKLQEEGNYITAGLLTGMQEYTQEIGGMFTQAEDFAKSSLMQIQSTFSDVIYDGLMGDLKTFKEYLRDFMQGILRLVAEMVAQITVKLGTIIAMKGIMSLINPAAAAIPTPVASASGNVLRGGFRAFAGGGVVSRPTLGLVGEGRYNEAVVPLPDGRRIPVQLQGGRGVTVNVIDNTNSGIEKNISQREDTMGNTVIDIVLDAVSRNREGFRSKLRNQLQLT